MSFRGFFLGRIFLGRIFLGGIFFYDIQSANFTVFVGRLQVEAKTRASEMAAAGLMRASRAADQAAKTIPQTIDDAVKRELAAVDERTPGQLNSTI